MTIRITILVCVVLVLYGCRGPIEAAVSKENIQVIYEETRAE